VSYRQSGFSYIEVLVATLLIVITLVPALESMQSGLQGSGIHSQMAEDHYRLIAKMEETLAKSFNELLAQADTVASPTVSVPAPYSDSAGSESRRLVYLSRYDGDNADADNDVFTGTDEGLIWVRVSIENSNQALETVTHD